MQFVYIPRTWLHTWLGVEAQKSVIEHPRHIWMNEKKKISYLNGKLSSLSVNLQVVHPSICKVFYLNRENMGFFLAQLIVNL